MRRAYRSYELMCVRQNGFSLQEEDRTEPEEPVGTSEIDELLPVSVSSPDICSVILYVSHLHNLLQRANLNPVAAIQRSVRRPVVQKRDWAHEVKVNKPMQLPKAFAKIMPRPALTPSGGHAHLLYRTS